VTSNLSLFQILYKHHEQVSRLVFIDAVAESARTVTKLKLQTLPRRSVADTRYSLRQSSSAVNVSFHVPPARHMTARLVELARHSYPVLQLYVTFVYQLVFLVFGDEFGSILSGVQRSAAT
jgi:hypothetical protein